ncbi:serine hydrolase [Streptomyces tirandamycinicus]|uniref:serine hydrolase n=1 Tax=Streptomyces tirandamycinicus TaxID=2174846 RepID=UPI00342585CB
MTRHRSPARSGPRISAAAALTALLLVPVGAAVLACLAWPEGGSVSGARAEPAGAVRTPGPSASAGPSLDEGLDAATEAVRAGISGHVSVALMDVDTGQSATAGDSRTYVTASIVKADVLAALLLQAQDAGRRLTEQERQWAAAMIRASDNAAATALWDVIGGADGLAEANRRLGLRETAPGQEGLWGLTETTVSDQLRLLRALFTAESALSGTSRAYVQELMGSVSAGQDWGVSAAGDAGSARLKNGWLPRSDTGLWVVNSIGLVERDGRRLLIAVLSDGRPTQEAGITLVEGVAEGAAAYLAGL